MNWHTASWTTNAGGTRVRPRAHGYRGVPRWGIVTIVVSLLVLGLMIFWLFLPRLIQNYVNERFKKIPDYSARIGAVWVHPFKGALSINNVWVMKTSGTVPVPLFFAARIDASPLWSALFRGAFVAKIALLNPIINLVDAKSPEEKQTGQGQLWIEVVKELTPIHIDRFRVLNGKFHFQNFTSAPPVIVKTEQINLTAQNLTNSEKYTGGLVSTIAATAVLQGHAPLELQANFDPYKKSPAFDLHARVTGLDLKALEDFAKVYAKADIREGTLDLLVEAKAAKGYLKANAKPLIYESNKVIATHIPLSGRIRDQKADVATTIVYVLRSALVKALFPAQENTPPRLAWR